MNNKNFIKLEKNNSSALIITNSIRLSVIPCVEKLVDILLSYKVTIYMCKSDSKRFKNDKIIFTNIEDAANHSDICFVIGGDGTILKAAKAILEYKIPILGINAGRLGFLSEIESHDISIISKLFENEIKVQQRTVLEVKKGNKKAYALNDCYVTKSEPGKISEVFVKCQGREICRYRADGIVLATPNGSTAYSMSAGGPVIDTDMDAIVMTPVCPHSLISCSIVFDPKKILSVGAATDIVEKDMEVLCDGEKCFSLGKGETITVEKSKRKVYFVNLSDRAFYEVLNEKFIGRRE